MNGLPLPQRDPSYVPAPLTAVRTQTADDIAYVLACLRRWAAATSRYPRVSLGSGKFDFLWIRDE